MVHSHEDVHVSAADASGSVDFLAPAPLLSRPQGILTAPPRFAAPAVPIGAGTVNRFVRVPRWSRKLVMLRRMVTIAPPHRSA
jgi:hypothetical protein